MGTVYIHTMPEQLSRHVINSGGQKLISCNRTLGKRFYKLWNFDEVNQYSYKEIYLLDLIICYDESMTGHNSQTMVFNVTMFIYIYIMIKRLIWNIFKKFFLLYLCNNLNLFLSSFLTNILLTINLYPIYEIKMLNKCKLLFPVVSFLYN